MQELLGIVVLQFVGRLLGGSVVGLTAASSKRTCAMCRTSRVCCSQSPCPRSRSLLPVTLQETLKHSKAGLAQCLVGSLGPGAHKVSFGPSERLWWVWGLILKSVSPLLLSFWGFSFALGRGIYFFGGTPVQQLPLYPPLGSRVTCFLVFPSRDFYTGTSTATCISISKTVA